MTINFSALNGFLSHPPTIAFYVRFMRCARFEWFCARQMLFKVELGEWLLQHL